VKRLAWRPLNVPGVAVSTSRGRVVSLGYEGETLRAEVCDDGTPYGFSYRAYGDSYLGGWKEIIRGRESGIGYRSLTCARNAAQRAFRPEPAKGGV
jgi:hypothetical protein